MVLKKKNKLVRHKQAVRKTSNFNDSQTKIGINLTII